MIIIVKVLCFVDLLIFAGLFVVQCQVFRRGFRPDFER